MENGPVLHIGAIRVPPGEEERYRRWIDEVHYPLFIKQASITEIDVYRIVSLKVGYPERISLRHHRDIAAWEEWNKSPLMADIYKDREAMWHVENLWQGLFQLTKGFLGGLPVSEDNLTTIVGNAVTISLLGFKISNERLDEFESWLNEWAFRAYIPILAKLPGIKAANFYNFTGRTSQKEIVDPDYPQSLAIFYFEDLKSYDNFEKSPELAVFRKAIKSDFPSGVNIRWNVQYQLVKSFRK